jgi:hypothetical protein
MNLKKAAWRVTEYLKSLDYISNVKLLSDNSITFKCSETREWEGKLVFHQQSWGKYYVTLYDNTTDYTEGETVRNYKQIINFLEYQYID